MSAAAGVVSTFFERMRNIGRPWRRPKAEPAAMLTDVTSYRRVLAPMMCRSAGHWFFRESTGDGPRLHVRAYSDERRNVGERLELEIDMDGKPFIFRGSVAWIAPLHLGPALYDVGIDTDALPNAVAQRLIQRIE